VFAEDAKSGTASAGSNSFHHKFTTRKALCRLNSYLLVVEIADGRCNGNGQSA